jgi:hypothetical protein
MTNKQREIIEAAIIALQAQRTRLTTRIAELLSQLDGSQHSVTTAMPTEARKRRKLSAAARKRISEAAKQRWAAVRKKRLAA